MTWYAFKDLDNLKLVKFLYSSQFTTQI